MNHSTEKYDMSQSPTQSSPKRSSTQPDSIMTYEIHGHMLSNNDIDNPKNWPLYRKVYASSMAFAFAFVVSVLPQLPSFPNVKLTFLTAPSASQPTPPASPSYHPDSTSPRPHPSPASPSTSSASPSAPSTSLTCPSATAASPSTWSLCPSGCSSSSAPGWPRTSSP
jgi:hypothetical protein